MYTMHISGLMKSYERDEIATDLDIEVPSNNIGKGVFLAMGDDSPSIPDDLLRSIHDKATWPSPSPLVLNLDVFMTQGLLQVSESGDWASLGEEWKAIVVSQGCIVQHVRKGTLGLLLQSNQYGVLAWPLVRRVVRGFAVAMLDLSPSAELIFWRVTTFDQEHWAVWSHTTLSPLETAINSAGDQLCGIYFQMPGQPNSLLEAAARRGFRGIQGTYLQKVATSLQLSLNNRKTVHSKIEALIRHILPDMKENDIINCLAAGIDAEESTLFTDESAVKTLDGVMNGEERQECARRRRSDSSGRRCRTT